MSPEGTIRNDWKNGVIGYDEAIRRLINLGHEDATDIVEDWRDEIEEGDMLRDATNSSDLRYRMWRVNNE